MRFAEQQFTRAKQLLDAGAMSQQEYEQAETNLNTAKAALEALKARNGKPRPVAAPRVTSPTGGVVGDIPVRVGDRVTTDAVLTTVDRAGRPRGVCPDSRLSARPMSESVCRFGSWIHKERVLAETAIDFVSPHVDDRTQSILVKAPVPASQSFRSEQFVRALVVWRNEPVLRCRPRPSRASTGSTSHLSPNRPSRVSSHGSAP